ncbi:3-deoxy-manno-octulosonate cytidylyltransferase [Runella sp.]|uniref:3-deoxy-manno-octulosonate cytidylyltransferase n=1 Tax=Runella sp. TaxID=1960881 RepID=UPI003D119E72
MIIGIILSRYAAERLPGKPLIKIKGKPIIQRVFEQAKQVKSLSMVVVATDDERIAKVISDLNGMAIMTRKDHISGTDRCWEAYQHLVSQKFIVPDALNYIINIQGDEPFIEPAQIDELAATLNGSIELATQICLIESPDILKNINEVKVTVDNNGNALYFSRNPIPYIYQVTQEEWPIHHKYFKHIGLYAYRSDILSKIVQLPPSTLELSESLEQLRWLEAGFKIKAKLTTYQPQDVNTEEDLMKIINKINIS